MPIFRFCETWNFVLENGTPWTKLALVCVELTVQPLWPVPRMAGTASSIRNLLEETFTAARAVFCTRDLNSRAKKCFWSNVFLFACVLLIVPPIREYFAYFLSLSKTKCNVWWKGIVVSKDGSFQLSRGFCTRCLTGIGKLCDWTKTLSVLRSLLDLHGLHFHEFVCLFDSVWGTSGRCLMEIIQSQCLLWLMKIVRWQRGSGNSR